MTTTHLTDSLLAIEYYRKASEASPSDQTPVSNLTAALYETGQYEQCILDTETALRLAASKENVDQPLVNKLKARLCKTYITLNDLHKAIEVVKDEKDLTQDTLSLDALLETESPSRHWGLTLTKHPSNISRRLSTSYPDLSLSCKSS